MNTLRSFDEQSTGVLFGLSVLVLATIILVVVLVVAGSYLKASAARRQDRDLRKLIERYEELAARVEAKEPAMTESLEHIQLRVDEIERVLKTV